jgi:hypothetical protein
MRAKAELAALDANSPLGRPPRFQEPAAPEKKPRKYAGSRQEAVAQFEGHSAPVAATALKRRTEVYVSISQAAIECSSTYKTVAMKFSKASLQPDPSAGVPNVYRLRDVLRVLYGIGAEGGEEEGAAIRDPFRRQAVAKSQLMELDIAKRRGELIPIAEVEIELARVAKIVSQTFDTIPDILERDAAVGGPQLAVIERHLDRARSELATKIEIPEEEPEVDDADAAADTTPDNEPEEEPA